MSTSVHKNNETGENGSSARSRIDNEGEHFNGFYLSFGLGSYCSTRKTIFKENEGGTSIVMTNNNNSGVT